MRCAHDARMLKRDSVGGCIVRPHVYEPPHDAATGDGGTREGAGAGPVRGAVGGVWAACAVPSDASFFALSVKPETFKRDVK
eukprot:7037981-Prymnesium_polylepis.1